MGACRSVEGKIGLGRCVFRSPVAFHHAVAGRETIDQIPLERAWMIPTVVIHTPKDAARLGIEVVYQDLALCDNLDVVQNMFLGREEHDLLFRLKEAPMEQRTAETLASLGYAQAAVLQGGVPRAEPIQDGGMEVPASMGMANAMNFQTVGTRVATTGDFVLVADEVNPVIRELRGHGLSSRQHQLENGLRPADLDWRWDIDSYFLHDVPAAVQAVKEKTGRSKIFYVGHSMGGNVALAVLERGTDVQEDKADTDVWMTSWDGAELFYRAWIPREATDKAVLLFHRGHEHSGRWQETVEALHLDDVAVFAWDARGHGRSPGERGAEPSE